MADPPTPTSVRTTSSSSSRKGLFKILRKKSNSPSVSSKRSQDSSVASSTTKVNTIGSDKTPVKAVNSKIAAAGDPTTARPTRSRSRRRSSSGARFIDNDVASLFDGDTDSDREEHKDDSDSSSTSNLSLRHSISSMEKGRTQSGAASPLDLGHFNEKVEFPSIDTQQDSISLDIQNNEDPPWVGITYESLVTPKYIRTSKRNKSSPKVLNNLFLAQELNTNEENLLKASGKVLDTDSNSNITLSDEEETAETEMSGFETNDENVKSNQSEIFVMEFSRDGMYLAAAGRDSVIKVWKVISSPLGRLEYKNAESERVQTKKKKTNRDDVIYESAPVFHRKPIRVFKGHSKSVLSLDWSKNNFLISGSMDRTVKLWHVDRDECLQTFQHEDFVTSVRFHPNDDRFFLSGSLDNQARLWSILENNVAFNKNLGDDVLITALAFTPDGDHCVVGGFNGSVFMMETKGLFVINRFEIKERTLAHPFQRNGNKITGVKIFANRFKKDTGAKTPLDKWTYLITTNDSKIRLVSSGRKLVTRFKGLTNNSSSIVASTSDDSRYIISGSEDHWCYVWENNNIVINKKLKSVIKDIVVEGKSQLSELSHKNKRYAKFMQDNKFIKKVLEDDDYDFISNENSSYTSFHAHHSKVNVALFAPENTKKLLNLSDDIIYDLVKRGEKCKFNHSSDTKCLTFDSNNDSRESDEGNIIVTTDQYGLIRVFRQDSAYRIRKKFISLYKEGKVKTNINSRELNRPHLSAIAPSNHTSYSSLSAANSAVVSALRLDLPGVGRKLSRHGRSLSPNPTDSYYSLKSKLPSIKKQPPSLQSSSMSPSASSKATQNSVQTVVTSSSLMNMKNARSPTMLFEGSDRRKRDSKTAINIDSHLIDPEFARVDHSHAITDINSQLPEKFPEVEKSPSSPKSTSPLIVNTASVEGKQESHLINFETPTSVPVPDDYFKQEIENLKLEPTRSKHRGRKK
ncbi:hypothetical protein G9P44_001365 [Scheffersomyces stipitis]|nr:hypothetical protein G9P44_001365 [Scheffersomyces stipitis]